MRKRLAETRLRQLWQQFPAVLILGERQVGKTTLAREKANSYWPLAVID